MKSTNKLIPRIVCLVAALILTVFFAACVPIGNEASESDPNEAKTTEPTDTLPWAGESETTTQPHDDGERSGVIELPRIPFQTEK